MVSTTVSIGNDVLWDSSWVLVLIDGFQNEINCMQGVLALQKSAHRLSAHEAFDDP